MKGEEIFEQLGQLAPATADRISQGAHEQVFATTDCLACAKCCKGYSPIMEEEDIERIARHLGMPEHQFAAKYLMLDEDDEWVIYTQPCPFLSDTNHCTIYAVRPASCADYPHTGRSNLATISDLTITNAAICPAVDAILHNIEQQLKDII